MQTVNFEITVHSKHFQVIRAQQPGQDRDVIRCRGQLPFGEGGPAAGFLPNLAVFKRDGEEAISIETVAGHADIADQRLATEQMTETA